jgi:hypothetical protein
LFDLQHHDLSAGHFPPEGAAVPDPPCGAQASKRRNHPDQIGASIEENGMGKIVFTKGLRNPLLICFLDDLKLLFHRKASPRFCHNTLNLSD